MLVSVVIAVSNKSMVKVLIGLQVFHAQLFLDIPTSESPQVDIILVSECMMSLVLSLVLCAII